MKALLSNCLVVLLILCAGTLTSAQQQKRLALVIGNAAYQYGGVLKNPVNDADLMARTLEDLGFEVIKETDASLRDMQSAFKDFALQLGTYDVALFFYAGHGMQVDGENYLIPIDAKLDNKLSMEFEAFKVSSVNRYFSYNSDKLNIMILDACRNNPYRSWARGGDRGFKAVSDQGAGTIIAFATSEGQTASDGKGTNGLFTQHLTGQMNIPQNITDVFQNTRIAVLEASNSQQVPQEWNMLTGNFYFTNSTLGASKDGPLLKLGKVSHDYGSIIINTPIEGYLFMNDDRLGYLQANSKGNELSRVKTGVYTLKIVGSETLSLDITVYKDGVTDATFEMEMKGDSSEKLAASITASQDRKINKKYGAISIDTPMGGDLYIDDIKMGYLEANSKDYELSKIITGIHKLEIVGSEILTLNITVNENLTTKAIFEKKSKINPSTDVTSFRDSRDSIIYKKVKIGKQVWMAEDLDYELSGSFLHSNNEEEFRLYSRQAAINACPEGWHLPSIQEWGILIANLGGTKNAGISLKSKTGWGSGSNGTNSSGFSAFPVGYQQKIGKLNSMGEIVYYWTSSEEPRAMTFRSGGTPQITRFLYGVSWAMSCRCVQDD